MASISLHFVIFPVRMSRISDIDSISMGLSLLTMRGYGVDSNHVAARMFLLRFEIIPFSFCVRSRDITSRFLSSRSSSESTHAFSGGIVGYDVCFAFGGVLWNTSISWFMMFPNEASHTIGGKPRRACVGRGSSGKAVSPEIIRADRAIVRRIILWFTVAYGIRC